MSAPGAPRSRFSFGRDDDEDNSNASCEHLEHLSAGQNVRFTASRQQSAELVGGAECTGITGEFSSYPYVTGGDHHSNMPSAAAAAQAGNVHVVESIQDMLARSAANGTAKHAPTNGHNGAPEAGGSISDDEAPVDLVPSEKQLTLHFANMEVWVPASFQQQGSLSKAKKAALKAAFPNSRAAAAAKESSAALRKQVLFGITGRVIPGEVLALMGPSGSGKTTLLSAIGGRVPQFVETSGAITVNGAPMTKAIRRKIGFVLQDDVLYESLTVWETLKYAAQLRLPRTMSKEEKEARVDEVMAALGLGKTRNSIIGGYMRRGVSGGERKRVSIGHELLINPAILLLDEPTSGLDSTTALHLLTLLRRLANEGRAVLTTIHQPSSRLYQKLDKLMLLSEGHVMYFGQAALVTSWFEHYGFRLGLGINTADFIMDVAMGEVRSGALVGKPAVAALQRTFEAWYRSNPNGYNTRVDANKMPRLLIEDDTTDADPKDVGRDLRVVVEMEPSAEKQAAGQVAVAAEKRVGASYPEQVGVLMQRALKVRRFEALTGTNMLQMLGVALITGLLWWQRGRKSNLAAANDILGLLFFELLFPSFRSLFAALFTFPNEFRMLLKERPSGMYKLSAYYFARILADLPIELLFPIMFQVIIYWFGGLRADAGAYFCNLASLLLIVLNAQSWGLLLGGLFMDPKTAQAVTTVVMLSFLLVSGFYVRDVPVWIDWLKYLSFIYWGYNLLLKIEFRHRSFTGVSNIKEALRLAVNPNQNVWLEVVVLLGMLLLLRLVTYFVLRRKTSGTKM